MGFLLGTGTRHCFSNSQPWGPMELQPGGGGGGGGAGSNFQAGGGERRGTAQGHLHLDYDGVPTSILQSAYTGGDVLLAVWKNGLELRGGVRSGDAKVSNFGEKRCQYSCSCAIWESRKKGRKEGRRKGRWKKEREKNKKLNHQLLKIWFSLKKKQKGICHKTFSKSTDAMALGLERPCLSREDTHVTENISPGRQLGNSRWEDWIPGPLRLMTQESLKSTGLRMAYSLPLRSIGLLLCTRKFPGAGNTAGTTQPDILPWWCFHSCGEAGDKWQCIRELYSVSDGKGCCAEIIAGGCREGWVYRGGRRCSEKVSLRKQRLSQDLGACCGEPGTAQWGRAKPGKGSCAGVPGVLEGKQGEELREEAWLFHWWLLHWS